MQQLKAAITQVTDRGEFAAIAAAYSVDRQGERIAQGAFLKTISAWRERGTDLPVHWDHRGEAANVIGSVDPERMAETKAGLHVEGKIDITDSEVAREVWRLMKARTVGLSFGFMVTKDHTEDGVRVLDELDVFEISVTASPANPDTRILSTKSATPVTVARFSA